MNYDYEIKLYEDDIEKDDEGKILYHPFIGPYYRLPNNNSIPIYFAGPDLVESKILEDIRVFFLMIHGEPDHSGREPWADPIRCDIFERLSKKGFSWYFTSKSNIFPGKFDSDGNYLPGEEYLPHQLFQTYGLEHISFRKPIGYGPEPNRMRTRYFFEASDDNLSTVVSDYWDWLDIGLQIDGFQMASNQIKLFEEWENRPWDDKLFREIMDEAFIAFYTFPDEHRHFVFLSNKLTLEELTARLDIDDLHQKAVKIGREINQEGG